MFILYARFEVSKRQQKREVPRFMHNVKNESNKYVYHKKQNCYSYFIPYLTSSPFSISAAPVGTKKETLKIWHRK